MYQIHTEQITPYQFATSVFALQFQVQVFHSRAHVAHSLSPAPLFAPPVALFQVVFAASQYLVGFVLQSALRRRVGVNYLLTLSERVSNLL